MTQQLAAEEKFNLNKGIFTVSFKFEDIQHKFPRRVLPTAQKKKNDFLDLALLSRGDVIFKHTPVPCDFPHTHYNYFSEQYAKVKIRRVPFIHTPPQLFLFFVFTEQGIFSRTQE